MIDYRSREQQEIFLKDCGTACGYWRDDSLVCYEVVTKKYSKDSGIVFVAEEMEADK